MKITKVLIVDDSMLIRDLFSEILSSDPAIEVVGTAIDPMDAREKIKQLNPDVITLDIEMPKMDGISFLKKIMSLRPMPVVMASSLTQKGAEQTFEALEIGAVDYVSKISSTSFDKSHLADELIAKVKSAAKANITQAATRVVKDNTPIKSQVFRKNAFIAIGASTGGVEALKYVLAKFPANSPPVVVVQHMPENFTATFAQRLDGICAMQVHEAMDGQKIEKGNVYIAPGSHHLEVQRSFGGYQCALNDDGLMSGHRPSVDVLFTSVAAEVGKVAVGAILTGMGKDGAIGMTEMKKSGAFNLGQDEKSCVVYGMPKAAYLAGAVDEQVGLDKMAKRILDNCI